MNVVYLSPHFPPNYYRFSVALKKAGATVLGLGDESYDRLHNELTNSITEYYHVTDMHHYNELVQGCQYFTDKYGKIDRFDSHNEYWLETEARIRDQFDIPGIRTSGISFVRRKSQMKEIFKKAGIAVAQGKVVNDQATAEKFVNIVGYPVVAKPDSGVGALNTYKINNKTELDNFIQNKPPVDYFMEEFVEGEIHSFDGLTNREGNLLFYTAHVYSQGIMETVNEQRNIFYYSFIDIPEELEKIGRACVKAFNVRERFFHFEFFKTKKGEFIALEVNMRPPGGFTTDMFNWACDIDIYQLWAELLVKEKTKFEFKRKYHCCYASRRYHKNYTYSHNDIVKNFQEKIIHHEPIMGVFSVALGDYGYIIRSKNINEIYEITNFIQSTY
jgi:biotin carboxylase